MKKALLGILIIVVVFMLIFFFSVFQETSQAIPEINFNTSRVKNNGVGSATLPNISLETTIGVRKISIKLILTEALLESTDCQAVLRIYQGPDEILIQEIKLPEPGIPSVLWGNIYSADVNFDGFNDIILNKEYHSENATVFNYCWLWQNEREEFVQAPEFEEFANAFLDTKNHLLQSYYRSSNSEYSRAAYSYGQGGWITEYTLTKAITDDNIVKYSEEIRNNSGKMVPKEYFIPLKIEQNFDEIYSKLVTSEVWNIPENQQIHFQEK